MMQPLSLYIDKTSSFMSIYSTTKDNSRTFCFTSLDELMSVEINTDENNIQSLTTEYSYSVDETVWSEFTTDFQSFLLGAKSIQQGGPVFIKIKFDVVMMNSSSMLSYFEVCSVKINESFAKVDYIEMSENSDILTTTRTSNLLDPYRKSDKQDILVKKISRSVSDIFGFDCLYFRTEPQKASYTFQTYTLSNVVEHKDVRIVIKDNYIPDNKTRFAEFDIDFQDEFEIHIVKEVFNEVFKDKKPNSNDFLWLPLTNQMYQINTVYDIKEFMNESTYYRVMLVKYELRADIDQSDESFEQITDLIDFEQDFHAEDVANEKLNGTKSYNDVKFNSTADHISEESAEIDGTQIFRWSYNFEDIHNFEKVLTYPIENVKSNQFSVMFWLKPNNRPSHHQLMNITNEFDQTLLYMDYDNTKNNFNIIYHIEDSTYKLSTPEQTGAIGNKWLGVVVNYIFENGKKLLSISIFDEELNLIQEAADTAVLQFTKMKKVDFYGSQHYANIRIAKTITPKNLMKQRIQNMLPEVNDYFVVDNAMPQINNIK